MPGPAALCCCASIACPAPELQAGCLCLSLLPGILVCNCLVSLLAPLLLSWWAEGEITVPHTLWLCSCFSCADTGRSCSAGTGRFEASPLGLRARASRDKWGRNIRARPMPALCFSGSFVSVARFSQAEFLTEISLFSPFPKAKGLISLKDFSSPVNADHAVTPSIPAPWSLTAPATLCVRNSFGQN